MSISLRFGVLMRAGGAAWLFQGQEVMTGAVNLGHGNGHIQVSQRYLQSLSGECWKLSCRLSWKEFSLLKVLAVRMNFNLKL